MMMTMMTRQSRDVTGNVCIGNGLSLIVRPYVGLATHHVCCIIIFRMDVDQSARNNAQEYFGVKDPDFYEFEGS